MTDDQQGTSQTTIPASDHSEEPPVIDAAVRPRVTLGQNIRREYKPKKKDNRKLLLIIMGIVVILVAGGAFLLSQWKPAPIEKVDTTIPLLTYKSEEIENVSIAVAGDTPYSVVVDLTSATLTYKVLDWSSDISLSQYALGDAFASATTLVAEEMIEENATDLAMYGLASPLSTMTVKLKSGQSQTYLLGNRLPTGVGWYLKSSENNTIYRISDYAGSRMSHKASDLRNLAILPTITTAETDYILIKRKDGETLELRKENSTVTMNLWKVLQPEPYEGSTEAILKLAEQINLVALKQYITNTQDLVPYGLDQPVATIMLKDSTGSRLYISIGNPVETDSTKTYAQLVGTQDVYTMETSALAFLKSATLVSVVDRYAALVNIAQVDQMNITTNGKAYKLSISRKEQLDDKGAVKLLGNGQKDYLETFFINDKQVEENPFKKIYQMLIALSVQGEIKGEVADQVAFSMSFVFNNGAEPLTVEYLAYQQDYYAIRQNGTSPLFYTRKEAVDTIAGQIESCLALPLTGDADKVTSIVITQGETIRKFALENGNATYQGKEITADQMMDAYKRLVGLTINDVVPKPSTNTVEMTIEYTYADGKAPIKIEYLPHRDGYAMAAEKQASKFYVQKSTMETEFANFDTWIFGK